MKTSNAVASIVTAELVDSRAELSGPGQVHAAILARLEAELATEAVTVAASR